MANEKKNAIPEIVASDEANPYLDPRTAQVESSVLEAVDMPQDRKPAPAPAGLAGVYKITHGSWKIGDREVSTGSVLKLSAGDALRGMVAETIEPHDERTKEAVQEHRALIRARRSEAHRGFPSHIVYDKEVRQQREVARG